MLKKRTRRQTKQIEAENRFRAIMTEIEVAENIFNNVTDQDLLDAAIYKRLFLQTLAQRAIADRRSQ